ncbi:MAG: hypothetical protein FWH17_02095 [Oscillospiraceae bacterium]|nr:hypothetical protein [Oscillospiraceae bacterium]
MAEAFVSADISKIAQFEKDSVEAIAEFNSIKNKFDSINTTLLSKWKGQGADAYKKESDYILEKIGGIKDVLDSINNSVVKDVKDNYLSLDEELGKFNVNPQSGEGG